MWSATEAFSVPSKAKTYGPAEQMVYLVQTGEIGQYKIGRTCRPYKRMLQYSRGGDTAYYVAQFIVESAEDAKRLERQAIRLLRTKFPQAKGFEWFSMSEADVLSFVTELKEQATVPIKEVRGSPGAEDPDMDECWWAGERIARKKGRHTTRLGHYL